MDTEKDITPAISEHVDTIAKQNGGILTKQNVLADAEDEASPLHSYFNWDDTDAAHQYRLEQSAKLIRRIRILVDVGDDSPVSVRKYVNVKESEGVGSYVGVDDALKNSHWKAIMLADALRELRAFREKYAVLKELAGVVAAAEKLEREVNEAADDAA